jgi:hypothetical protein
MSAATILQRAVALELDVDSLGIEIASVHRIRTDDGPGTELYLADAHPNGDGLVRWAHDHWLELLRGLLLPGRSADRLGRVFEQTLGRNDSGSAEALLRGFRNRQLHGLLDYATGMDLLATLLDERHEPGGAERLVEGRTSATLVEWRAAAVETVRRYADAFTAAVTRRSGESSDDPPGWVEEGEDTVFYAAVHPLWSLEPGVSAPVGQILDFARTWGARQVRFASTFDLARRMGWVRLHRTALPCLGVP